MTSAITRNETLDRMIRTGGWAELAEGTPRLIARAIEADDIKNAKELGSFFVTQMQVVYDIYEQWFRDIRRFFLDNGMDADAIEAERQKICDTLAPYHQSADQPRAQVWESILQQVSQASTPHLEPRERLEALEMAVSIWRDLHDCEVDQLSGLFHLVISQHGEPALREMYEGWVIGDWFAKRYQRFDVSKIDWETASWLLIYLGFEGHHGHLSGAERDGTIEVSEDEEKVTISFAPCGSGGRAIIGDPRKGLPAHSEPPINWPELSDAHDFTWNETGICSYCAHCCILHENLPIAAFGYPVRVTDPPKAPLSGESRCSWTVYKDLRAIPEWAYQRVGAVKPPADAPLGSEHRAAREALLQKAFSE